ncbi:uncharacterized protein [Littorina saxatilis]|uniref:uncharacterized protein isoform X2 n=1 Tax=Littorina saxatilis TaxID=31220 RepID=UPI0038B43D03
MATPGSEASDVLESSTDYSKYGITDVPKFAVTTALGKTKTFAGLYYKEWIFLVISFLNISTAVALTLARLVQVVEDDPKSSDFTFGILLLINAGFCLFYVLHGVLRERVYEIYAFMAAILVVLFYCILEYAVFNPSRRTDIKLGRLIVACVMAPPNIIIAWFVSRDFGYLEFRIVGASQFLQYLYRQAALFSCLLKFDLQATLRRELKGGAIAFAVIGLVKPGYYLYKVITTYIDIRDGIEPSQTITYSLLAATALGLLVWLMLMWELTVVYKSFGKGLKEHTKDVLATETTGLLSSNRKKWRP